MSLRASWTSEIGVHFLEPCILCLQVLQAFRGTRGETAVLGLSAVTRRVADADFPAEVALLRSALIAFKHGANFGLAESRLFHGSKINLFSVFDEANFGEACLTCEACPT